MQIEINQDPIRRSPEQRMWRAALAHAYMDLTHRDPRVVTEVEEWFFSPEFEDDLRIVAEGALDKDELADGESPVEKCRAHAIRLLFHVARTPFDVNTYDGGRKCQT